MKINSKELTKKIKLAMKTMSRNNQDNKINRIYYQDNKLVGTDSFILSEIDMKIKNSFNFSIREFYIKKLLSKISKLNTDIKVLKTKKGVNFTFINNDGKKETFKVKYDKNYETLDYKFLTNNNYENKLTLNRKDVKEILKNRKVNNLIKDQPDSIYYHMYIIKVNDKIDLNFKNKKTEKKDLISFKSEKKINDVFGASKRYINDIFKILKQKEINLESDGLDLPIHFFEKDISIYLMPMDID